MLNKLFVYSFSFGLGVACSMPAFSFAQDIIGLKSQLVNSTGVFAQTAKISNHKPASIKKSIPAMKGVKAKPIIEISFQPSAAKHVNG